MKTVRQLAPVHDAATLLSGQEFPEADLPCHEFYHILGFGPRQINVSAAAWKHHLRCTPRLSEKEIREWKRVWNDQHPEFDRWSRLIGEQMRKDGYVENPHGRRIRNMYVQVKTDGGDVRYFSFMTQAALILSTAFDYLKDAILQSGIRPAGISFGRVACATDEDAARLLAVPSKIRWEGQ